MATLVHIKPRKGSKVVGDAIFSGKIKDKNGVEHNHKGRNVFSINGNGELLDTSLPEHQKRLDIIDGPMIRKVFNRSSGSGYRFDKVDIEKDAETYLTQRKHKLDLGNAIENMKEHERKYIGFVLGMKGSDNMIKQKLHQMVDTDATRAKVAKLLLSPDKLLIMYVYNGLDSGDGANKKGLYKADNGVYYFNATSLGIDVDNIIAEMKSKTEQGEALHKYLSDLYKEKAK